MTTVSSPTENSLVVYQPSHPSEKAHLEERRRCEELFLNTYKALHLGGKETLESRIIRTMSMSAPTHSAEEMERRLSQYEKANRYLKGLHKNSLLPY